ncbi:MAG: hypothetical protein HKO64_09750 [Xanthomonadales bacterium]|nr:hypothetical protein [Xanthomonadales bacterium]
MNHIFRTSLLLLLAVPVFAQQGPEVPCADCEARNEHAWPTSGPWANTHTDGSGFLFEIQNGEIAGWYFGYNEAGDPQWYLFNSPLINGTEGDVSWMAAADLLLFEGGNCINCPWQGPGEPQTDGTIKLEFFQRNHGRFQFGDSEPEFMVPLLFGSAGKAHIPEQTDYVFPELAISDEDRSAWVLVSTDHSGDSPVLDSTLVHFKPSFLSHESAQFRRVHYHSVEFAFSLASPNPPFMSVSCGPDSFRPELHCDLIVNVKNAPPDTYMNYTMPIANLGANRFFAEDENGNTIEGYRIGYD